MLSVMNEMFNQSLFESFCYVVLSREFIVYYLLHFFQVINKSDDAFSCTETSHVGLFNAFTASRCCANASKLEGRKSVCVLVNEIISLPT